MITDYASLQDAIKSESHRSDLDALIPDFIQLAERQMVRELPIRLFETSVTGTSTGTLALPADFDRIQRLSVITAGRKYPLDYTSPNGITDYISGNPYRYTVLDGQIQFVPETGGEYQLDYLRKLVPLSNTNTSNFVLAEHPDAYLYGGLLHLYMHTRDEEQISKYAPLFATVLASIVTHDERKRLPLAGGLQIKPRGYR